MTPFVHSLSAVHLYDLHSRKYVNIKVKHVFIDFKRILHREYFSVNVNIRL